MSPTIKRAISVFGLAMINVAAIGSVKNWPLTAEYGFSSLFFFVLAALIFFIPVSLVSAELATGWPKTGGIYVWVKEAFGHRLGFLSIWLLWIENVIWYPTILSFIAATISYIIDPALADNRLYTAATVLVIFWGVTFANMFGMRTSTWISTIGVLFGTVIPGVFIIGLGLVWFFQGQPLQISFTLNDLIPNMTNPEQMVFFTGVMFTLAGMEMSAIHARDVKHPQSDYPKAILLSGLFIFGFSILGVLAIACVIPQKEISLVAGSLQAFAVFVDVYHLKWLLPFIAALIAVGAIGSLSTWTAGPSKGLLAAAQGGDLPPLFRRINKRGMPAALLITQAIIVTLLSLMFLFMPSVSSAFWILTAMVAQLYLIMYLLMFAAAIKLRYSKANVKRPYKVPGGKVGMWIVSIVGMSSSIYAIIIGFFPPSQIATGSQFFYFSFLICGMIITCLAPILILKFKKPHWDKALAHEKRDSDFA